MTLKIDVVATEDQQYEGLTDKDLDPVLDIPVTMNPGSSLLNMGIPMMTQFGSFVPIKADAVTPEDKDKNLPVDTARTPGGDIPPSDAPEGKIAVSSTDSENVNVNEVGEHTTVPNKGEGDNGTTEIPTIASFTPMVGSTDCKDGECNNTDTSPASQSEPAAANLDGDNSPQADPEPEDPEIGDYIPTLNLNDEPVNEVPDTTASFTPVISNLDGETEEANPEPEEAAPGDKIGPTEVSADKCPECGDDPCTCEASDCETQVEELAKVCSDLDDVKQDLDVVTVTEPLEGVLSAASEALDECQTAAMVASAHLSRKIKAKAKGGITVLADVEDILDETISHADALENNLDQLEDTDEIKEVIEAVGGFRNKLLRTKANVHNQLRRKMSAQDIVDDNIVVVDEICDTAEKVESDIQDIQEVCIDEAQPVVTSALGSMQSAAMNMRRIRASMKQIVRASHQASASDDNVKESIDTAIEKVDDVVDAIDNLKEACTESEVTAHLNRIVSRISQVKASMQALVADIESQEDFPHSPSDDEPVPPEDAEIPPVDPGKAEACDNVIPLNIEIPEDVDSNDVVMTLHAEASMNPFWNIILAGEPVAQVYLEDQEDPDGVRDTFISTDYENTVANAIASYGSKKTLKMVRARPFVYRISESSMAKKAREQASRKAQASIEKAQASMLDRFLYATTVVTAGLTKNFYKGANRPLHHAIFNEAQAHGVYNPAAFTEKCMMAGCEPFMEEVIARAVDFMAQSPEVQKQIASAIDESLPQPPEEVNADDEALPVVDPLEDPKENGVDTMVTEPVSDSESFASMLGKASLPISAGMGISSRPNRTSYKDQLKASLGFDRSTGRMLRIGR